MAIGDIKTHNDTGNAASFEWDPSSASRTFFFWALPCVLWLSLLYVGEIRIEKWPVEVSGYPPFRDFANLWAGAVGALHDHLKSVFDRGLHDAALGELLGISPLPLMWSYPPTALLLVLPFGLLSFWWASAIWMAAGLTAYFLAAGVTRVDKGDRVAWFGAIALCPGLVTCLAYGQASFLTSAALITGALEARRRPILAGGCFALLAAKPQTAIVVPFVLIALREWRALLSFAVFTCLFLVATILVFGVEAWRLFLDITAPQQFAVLNSTDFKAFMMISPYFLFRELGISLWWSYASQLVVSLAVITVVCATVPRERDRNIQVLLIVCAALLTSAYMQAYELPLLVAAVARICTSRESLERFSGVRLHVLLASVTTAMMIVMAVALTIKINVTPIMLMALLAWLGRGAACRNPDKIGNLFPLGIASVARRSFS